MRPSKPLTNTWLLLLLLTGTLNVAAQSPQLKGTVIDQQGSPLDGVSVVVKQKQVEIKSTATGKDPMMPADAFASALIPTILACIF